MEERRSTSDRGAPATARAERDVRELVRGGQRWIAPATLTGTVLIEYVHLAPEPWTPWVNHIQVGSAVSLTVQMTVMAAMHTLKWLAPNGKIEFSWSLNSSGKA
ncbi:hypothetical protein ACFV4P_02650 [Kitasatospora sp. NPDC059795]|uniref:hypothetical protein n=1 Tax=Kitasatospora sp. NPDC059795 TaxID=3346949 RepID=UPI00366071C7